MIVNQVMTKDVHACRSDDRMSEAARRLWEHDCGCLPVVDDTLGVVGVITDRDICMAAYTQGRPLAEMTVASAMTRHVATCDPEDPLSDAEATMRSRQVRRIPVVNESNRLVGMLSLNDIALAAAGAGRSKRGKVTKAEVADTLAAICRRDVLAPVEA